MIVYLDGRWETSEKACIMISDELLIGNGVFTTIKVKEGRIFYLEEHIKRLQDSCVPLQIPPPLLCKSAFYEMLERNQAGNDSFRMKAVILSGGIQKPAHFLLTMKPYEEETTPCMLCIYPEPIIKPTAKLKTLAYLDRWLIKQYATSRGFYDAICLSLDDYILETGFSNLFWKADGEIFTPDPKLPLLYGIAIQKLLQDKHVHHVSTTLDTIPSHAQVYVCNALSGPRQVAAIENRSFALDEQWHADLTAAFLTI